MLKHPIQLILITFCLIANNLKAFSQVSITPTTIQTLDFGSFYLTGSGGTVTISTGGVRSSTGSILLVGGAVGTPLTFTVKTGNQTPPRTGTSRWDFNIAYPNSVSLNRTGGGSMTLNLTISSASFSLSKNSSRIVYFGGKLNVGTITANPAGSYSGSFTVTFNYN